MNHYIIVLEIKENGIKQVQKVIVSDEINDTNVGTIAKALSKLWGTNSKMFPAPRYDIVIGVCENIKIIENEIPKSRGWESVHIESLATSTA
jgi:hypothetical protein